jgi:hypothetical protein
MPNAPSVSIFSKLAALIKRNWRTASSGNR